MKVVVARCVFHVGMDVNDFADISGADDGSVLWFENCEFYTSVDAVLDVLNPLPPDHVVKLAGLEFHPGMAVVIDGATLIVTGIKSKITIEPA